MDFNSKISKDFTSKDGIFDPENVKERAKRCRRWLREQDEEVIAGVSLLTLIACVRLWLINSCRARRYLAMYRRPVFR
jgi:hypothetical protein